MLLLCQLTPPRRVDPTAADAILDHFSDLPGALNRLGLIPKSENIDRLRAIRRDRL
jgi:hypothetical protein